MTVAEARHWLTNHYSDWQEDTCLPQAMANPQDAIDEILFVQKNYFLTKLAVAKLFEPKIKLLNQLEEVAEAFSLKNELNKKGFLWEENDELLPAYHFYYRLRNQLKQKLLQSPFSGEVAYYAELMCQYQKQYAAQWNVVNSDFTNVLVSQEPDPMLLLEALRQYQNNGGNSFAQLADKQNNPPEILLNEQKRLSLLFQKY